MAIKFFETNDVSDIARAIPTAIQGYYDAKAREREELELNAKIQADERKSARQKILDKIAMTKDLVGLQEKGRNVSNLSQEVGDYLGGGQQQQVEMSGEIAGQGMIKPGLMQSQKRQGLLPPLTDEAKMDKRLKRAETVAKLQKTKMEPSTALRKEWAGDDTTKRTKQVAESYNRIIQSATNPSAAGDLSLVFNYMKMLDPGSVVRESEFKSAEQARAAISKLEDANVYVPGFLRQGVQKLTTGKFLLPEQRKDFAGQASNLFNAQMQKQNQINRFYQKLSQDYGIEPGRVVREDLFVPMDSEGRVEGAKVLEGLPGSGKEIDSMEENELDELNRELDRQLKGFR